jgi:hypothetical protein
MMPFVAPWILGISNISIDAQFLADPRDRGIRRQDLIGKLVFARNDSLKGELHDQGDNVQK